MYSSPFFQGKKGTLNAFSWTACDFADPDRRRGRFARPRCASIYPQANPATPGFCVPARTSAGRHKSLGVMPHPSDPRGPGQCCSLDDEGNVTWAVTPQPQCDHHHHHDVTAPLRRRFFVRQDGQMVDRGRCSPTARPRSPLSPQTIPQVGAIPFPDFVAFAGPYSSSNSVAIGS